MRKVLFIGAIRENELALGGEEYKNQLILSKLKKEPIDLTYIDSLNWKKSPVIIFRLLWILLFESVHNIIISASSVSTYRLFYFLCLLKPKVLPKTSYFVIGGYFPEAIESGRFKHIVYSKLKIIVVEGVSLKNRLIPYFTHNDILVIPNFKRFPTVVFPAPQIWDGFKFVFVGRVSSQKGVTLIIEASKRLRLENPAFNFVVDFYGPLEENFGSKDGLDYKGYLDFQGNTEQSYSRLSEYDCLLFPTYWQGEGFPGVIIDAFIAGLPVIATDWNMNREIIEENVNGFIIEPKNANALADKMKWAMENQAVLKVIGENNRKKAKEYHIDEIWPKLIAHVVS